MQAVLIICFAALLGAASAQSGDTCYAPTYNETLVPACNNNAAILLPNYEDITTYWMCQNNQPVPMQCSSPTGYFCYVLQACTSCAQFIPAVTCSELYIQKECVAIGSGNNTTAAPTTVTTAATPTDSGSDTTSNTTVSGTTGVSDSSTGTGSDDTTVPQPPTEDDGSTGTGSVPTGTIEDVGTPPSPNVGPTPPGPAPTAPNYVDQPPTANSIT